MLRTCHHALQAKLQRAAMVPLIHVIASMGRPQGIMKGMRKQRPNVHMLAVQMQRTIVAQSLLNGAWSSAGPVKHGLSVLQVFGTSTPDVC